MSFLNSWQAFALGSAFFAGLTAIFGKLGVVQLNSNLATFFRTVVIVVMTAAIVTFQQQWKSPTELPLRSVFFLVLSAFATGLSWLCYYRALQLGPVSQVAVVDKLSVAFAIGIALICLGESLSVKAALGVAFVIFGSVLVATG